MNVLARAAALVCVAVLPVVLARPASATVVPIPAQVFVNSVPDGFDVCAYGRATSTTNLWRLRVDGVRYYEFFTESQARGGASTGTVIGQSASGSQPIFDVCLFVSRANAAAGDFQVTLAYAGAGPDVALVLVGQGTWAGSFSNGIGTNIGSGP